MNALVSFVTEERPLSKTALALELQRMELARRRLVFHPCLLSGQSPILE
jgi:hypothetical protein